MYRRLQDRFGSVGVVVAVVALVVTLGGTAIAAGALTGSQKKEVSRIATKIAKKYAGQPGAIGPQGPQGVPGTNGTNGADGVDGRSVVLSNGASGCPEGGVTAEVEGTGETDEICNGEEGPAGDPWTAGGTLPSGATETGFYAIQGTAETLDLTALSLPIPLSSEIPFAKGKINDAAKGTGDLTSGEAKVTNLVITGEGRFSVGAAISGTGIPGSTFINACAPNCTSPTELTLSQAATATGTAVEVAEGPFPECENATHAGAASVSNPEAQSGYICVFAANSAGRPTQVTGPTAGTAAGVAGAKLRTINSSAAFGAISLGAYAVTAP